jgi:DNA-binding NarL/FixJ family response regulator
VLTAGPAGVAPRAPEAEGERDPGAVRVVLAEDDLLVREGLLRVLERQPGVRVVAAVGCLGDLLDAVERHRPDVVVTDICMPPGHRDEGLEAARLLGRDHPAVGVLVLSQHADPAYAHRLLAGGARGRGYLIKDRLCHRGKLRDAIRAVHAGESRIDAEVVDLLVAYRAGSAPGP